MKEMKKKNEEKKKNGQNSKNKRIKRRVNGIPSTRFKYLSLNFIGK